MPTIPPNNTSGLYGIDNGTTSINNDVVANAISANTIYSSGNITTGGYFIGNIAGNISGGDGNFTNLTVTNQSTINDLTIQPGAVIDAGLNIIGNVLTPVANSDVATKEYVDSQTSGDLFAIQDDFGGVQGVAKLDTITFSGVANETLVEVTAPDTVTIGLPDDLSLVGNLDTGGTITANANITGANLITNGNLFFGTDTPLEWINADNLTMSFITNGQTRLAITSGGAQIQGALSLVPTIGNGILTAQGVNSAGNINGSNLNATANVHANYYFGNGSQLTGLTTSISGNLGGNLEGNGFGIANVTFVTSTGNITASGQFNGSGAGLTNIPGANITGTVANATYALTANVANFANSVDGANVNGAVANATYATTANLANFASTAFSVDGANVNGAVANATYALTANVANFANSVDGANVTGTVANAAYATTANLANFATTAFSVSGANVSGEVANAAYALTANVANFANSVAGANVTGTVANATYADTANLANFATTVLGNSQPNITSVGNLSTLTVTGNMSAGNISTTGVITASGNITGDYFLGNGSQLTGMYGNANVANYLPTYTGNLSGGNLSIANNANINNDLTVGGTIYGTFSGNITGNLVVPGANTEVLFNNDGNAGASADFTFNDATNTMTVNGTANVTALNATGNVTANYFIGNGSALTSLTGANVTGTVANATYAISANSATFAGTVTTNAQPNITSVGNLTSLTVAGDTLMLGNLEVQGNVTYISSNTVTINDKFINVANNAANSSQANGGGIGVGPVGSEYATWSFSDANTAWQSNIKIEAPTITASGNITANYFIGNGSALASITGANVTGEVANAAYATTANLANFATTAFNVSGANVSGEVANAAYATTANLANFATTAFSVDGANVNGAVANATYANTANLANFATTVLGNAQPNITSVGNLTSLTVTGNASAGNISTTGVITATGNITGNYFLGNGSQLTGLVTTISGNLSGNIEGNGFGIANVTFVTSTGNISGANIVATANVNAANINATDVYATYLHGDGSNITGVVAGSASTQLPVKNTTGSTIAAGTPVYATGTVGASTTLEIAPSLANTAATMPAVGLTTTSLAPNGTGYAISVGTLKNVNTSTYSVGQILYVAPGGGLTATRPNDGYLVQPVGTVGRVGTGDGSIDTNVWNYFQLPNLGSGNIWLGNATQIPTETTLATYTGNIGAGNITVTGNITGGNISTTGVFTASNTTANLQVANLIFNNQNYQTVGNRNLSVVSSTVADPGRITVGSGFNGNYSPTYDINVAGRGARFLVTDSIDQPDNGQRTYGISVQDYVTLTGNVTNNNTRLGGASFQTIIGGGSSSNTMITTTAISLFGMTSAVVVGGGTSGSFTSLGNTTVNAVTGQLAAAVVNTGSTARSAFGLVGLVLGGGGSIGNAIGYSSFMNSGGNPTFTGNVYSFYNPGSASDFGLSTSANARAAPNYYFLRNDDDVAQTKMGSMRLWHNYRYDVTPTTGAITIDKNNGQTQYLAVTGNITGITLSNFVTSANDSVNTDYQTDTVTLYLRQDATGRTITMPTGANYFYLSGNTTVSTAANSVSKIEFTAIDNSGTTQYLIDISAAYTST